MPIESAIIKQNKLNHKAMSVADFRTACHEFADHYIDVQREGFKRMGVVADWEHPYKTMDPGFEAREVRVFGQMYKNGHIYKGLKPVYWCPHDETALAEAEIEYQDDPCTTVYVKFPMHDDLGKLSHLDKSKLSFVIWTTTIWTLPGNLAIALHPGGELRRGQGRRADDELYIMAEALTEKVMGIGGFDRYEIVETHPGCLLREHAGQPSLPAQDQPPGAGGLCHHGLRYRLRPHRPRLRRRRLSDLPALRHGHGGARGRPGPPHGLRRQVRRYEDRGIQPRDPSGYEGGRFPVCQPGDRPQLSPLLALQEAHHLPGHPPVVLLRGVLQGRRHRRLRGRALGALLGQGPPALHGPGAHRLVHQPPAPLGPAHPGVLLQGLRQAHLHRRDHRRHRGPL